jgi:hypothetical protein
MIHASIKEGFSGLLQFREWANRSITRLSPLNKRYEPYFLRHSLEYMMKTNPGWFGEGVTVKELEAGVVEYRAPHLLEEVLSKVSHIIAPHTTSMAMRKVLKYNDRGLGNFSFERASMVMYRLKEYYSTLHRSVVPQSEVDFSKRGLRLRSDGSPVEERWETRQDGGARARTGNKRVFAYFQKRRRESRMADILVASGGNQSVDAHDLLYSGVAAIVTAQILAQAGFRTRIHIMFGSFEKPSKDRYVGCLVPVKGFDEPLDMNLVALGSSDPRFFRYDGMKGYVCAYDEFKRAIPSSFGYGADATSLKKVIEESNYDVEARLSGNRIYFGRNHDEASTIKAIKQALKILDQGDPSNSQPNKR